MRPLAPATWTFTCAPRRPTGVDTAGRRGPYPMFAHLEADWREGRASVNSSHAAHGIGCSDRPKSETFGAGDLGVNMRATAPNWVVEGGPRGSLPDVRPPRGRLAGGAGLKAGRPGLRSQRTGAVRSGPAHRTHTGRPGRVWSDCSMPMSPGWGVVVSCNEGSAIVVRVRKLRRRPRCGRPQ